MSGCANKLAVVDGVDVDVVQNVDKLLDAKDIASKLAKIGLVGGKLLAKVGTDIGLQVSSLGMSASGCCHVDISYDVVENHLHEGIDEVVSKLEAELALHEAAVILQSKHSHENRVRILAVGRQRLPIMI